MQTNTQCIAVEPLSESSLLDGDNLLQVFVSGIGLPADAAALAKWTAALNSPWIMWCHIVHMTISEPLMTLVIWLACAYRAMAGKLAWWNQPGFVVT